MSEAEPKALGEIRATISREIVRLQAEYYGKGPTKAKTYVFDDLVVVVLEETFTRAEKTLVQRGEADAIQHIRRRFQQQMAEEFTSVVEQATGRKVRAFLSETNIEQDVSVETFLLSDERTDMTTSRTPDRGLTDPRVVAARSGQVQRLPARLPAPTPRSARCCSACLRLRGTQ